MTQLPLQRPDSSELIGQVESKMAEALPTGTERSQMISAIGPPSSQSATNMGSVRGVLVGGVLVGGVLVRGVWVGGVLVRGVLVGGVSVRGVLVGGVLVEGVLVGGVLVGGVSIGGVFNKGMLV